MTAVSWTVPEADHNLPIQWEITTPSAQDEVGAIYVEGHGWASRRVVRDNVEYLRLVAWGEAQQDAGRVYAALTVGDAMLLFHRHGRRPI